MNRNRAVVLFCADWSATPRPVRRFRPPPYGHRGRPKTSTDKIDDRRLKEMR
jgi:hypothetical protein